MGWFAIIATIFAIGATFVHDRRDTKIFLSVVYGLVVAISWAITKSIVWTLSIAGVISTILGYWVMHNFEQREREQRERDRE